MGAQEDIDVDPLWNPSTVKACAAGMREMANTNSVVVIAVGTLAGQFLWTSELSSGGWTVEIEPRVVQLDKEAANRKFHACKKRKGVLVMQHYAWVVAYRGYKNIWRQELWVFRHQCQVDVERAEWLPDH